MWMVKSVLFSTLILGALTLRITELIVPSHANLGESVTLKCMFELARARLYSVKWYKDETEFYRYMPDNTPQTQIFPTPGILIDASLSDMNSVTLTQLSYRNTGAYKCEVSTEGPKFDTAIKTQNMTVLAFPDSEPLITGVLSTYTVGDYITANCSSGRSNPAPRLSWFINGVKAESWLLDKYPITEDPGPLYSRSLSLRFQAEKRHFQGPGSTVQLRCTSVVSDLPPKSAVVTPRLDSYSSNQKIAQERLRNKAVNRSLSIFLMFGALVSQFLS